MLFNGSASLYLTQKFSQIATTLLLFVSPCTPGSLKWQLFPWKELVIKHESELVITAA